MNLIKLFESVNDIGSKLERLRTILMLFKDQSINININEHKEKAKIRRGCSLSPYLFNFFYKYLIRLRRLEKLKLIYRKLGVADMKIIYTNCRFGKKSKKYG